MQETQNALTVPRSAFEIFRFFLKLDLTCFGGPIAHIGYFRNEFITRRQWLNDQSYSDLVGLCQFLPGPASGQRSGWIFHRAHTRR